MPDCQSVCVCRCSRGDVLGRAGWEGRERENPEVYIRTHPSGSSRLNYVFTTILYYTEPQFF